MTKHILFITVVIAILFYLGNSASFSFLSSYLSPDSNPLFYPANTSAGKNTSRNWSGYAAVNGTFTSINGTWTVPYIKSTNSFGADATWIGIGGVSSEDLIQAGTQDIVNRNGQVSYDAFIEILPNTPQPVALTVHGGDSISVSVAQQSQEQWLISFQDNTNGQTAQVSESYNSSLSSAEWIEESPSGIQRVMPLDNFGEIQFTNGSAIKNGQSVTIANANAYGITMVDNFGRTLAATSGLNNLGNGFSVNRTNPSTADVSSVSRPYYLRIVHRRMGYIHRLTPKQYGYVSY